MLGTKNKKVKLIDVAKTANVSVATASLALANRPEISHATRQRVHQAKDDLGYKPLRVHVLDKKEKGKVKNKSNVKRFGYILVNSQLSDDAFSIEIHKLQDVASKMDIRLEVAAIEDTGSDDTFIKNVLNIATGLDGLILSNDISRDLIRRVYETGTPFIVIGSYEEISSEDLDIPVCSIDSDTIAMGHLAASHLIKAGHTKIAFICETLPKGQLNYRWLLGVKAALDDANIPVNPEYIQVADHLFAGGEPAAKAFSEMKEPPTAFIIPDIRVAGQFVVAMKLRGIEVDPKSFIIYGDKELTKRYQVENYPRIELNELTYQVALEKLDEICKHTHSYLHKVLLPFKFIDV